jgi:hypothetical protein
MGKVWTRCHPRPLRLGADPTSRRVARPVPTPTQALRAELTAARAERVALLQQAAEYDSLQQAAGAGATGGGGAASAPNRQRVTQIPRLDPSVQFT